MSTIIEPHGGELKERLAGEEEAGAIRKASAESRIDICAPVGNEA